jgi:hypothetical protein
VVERVITGQRTAAVVIKLFMTLQRISAVKRVRINGYAANTRPAAMAVAVRKDRAAVTANAMTCGAMRAMTTKLNQFVRRGQIAATARAATRLTAKAAWMANAKFAVVTRLKNAVMARAATNQTAKAA